MINQLRRNRIVIGAIVGILPVHFFVAEFFAWRAWTGDAHSLMNNYISDLGIPYCDTILTVYMCSPLHMLMNGALVLQGFIYAVATVCLYVLLPIGRGRSIAVASLVAGAIGMILLGFFHGTVVLPFWSHGPETFIHLASATVTIFCCNLAMLVVAFVLFRHKKYRRIAAISLVCGAMGMAAFVYGMWYLIFVGYPRINGGFVEHLMIVPGGLWLTLVSGIILANRSTWVYSNNDATTR